MIVVLVVGDMAELERTWASCKVSGVDELRGNGKVNDNVSSDVTGGRIDCV